MPGGLSISYNHDIHSGREEQDVDLESMCRLKKMRSPRSSQRLTCDLRHQSPAVNVLPTSCTPYLACCTLVRVPMDSGLVLVSLAGREQPGRVARHSTGSPPKGMGRLREVDDVTERVANNMTVSQYTPGFNFYIQSTVGDRIARRTLDSISFSLVQSQFVVLTAVPASGQFKPHADGRRVWFRHGEKFTALQIGFMFIDGKMWIKLSMLTNTKPLADQARIPTPIFQLQRQLCAYGVESRTTIRADEKLQWEAEL
jgi:hypothetical protein